MSFQDTRRNHDMKDILGVSKSKIVCPLPGHKHVRNTPSFSIFWFDTKDGYSQFFRCHGSCGRWGDVIDLYGYINIPGYDKADFEMRVEAARMLDNKYPLRKVEPPPLENLLPMNALEDTLPISPRAKAYALSRGLVEADLEFFKLGSSFRHGYEYLTLPTIEDGKLIGIKMRNIGEGGYRYVNVKGSSQGLFNHDEVFWDEGVVFVVKGEIAAIIMRRYLNEHGLEAKVCAPSGGETSRKLNPVALAFSNNIVVADNDQDPKIRKSIMKATRLRAAFFDGKIVSPPEPHKGVDDWLLATWDDPETKEVIEKWMALPDTHLEPTE